MTFLTPYYTQGRGNATTARRIITGLKSQLSTTIIPYEEKPYSIEIEPILNNSKLVHVLHFRRFAEWKYRNQIDFSSPYVITSGGTDVNIDIFQEKFKDLIGDVLRDSAAITVFSLDAKLKLLDVYQDFEEKIHIINQSVWFPDDRQQTPIMIAQTRPNILLPAGLRKVKDVLFVLPALQKLKSQFPLLSFTIIGTAIEKEVVDQVNMVRQSHPWINYIEEVPLEQMKSIYEQTDLVINSSLSEGQSSAILEAMLLDKPVIARKNGGNESIITDHENGFLFDSVEEFYLQCKRVLTNTSLTLKVVTNARNYVRQQHSLEEEVRQYLRLYSSVVEKNRR